MNVNPTQIEVKSMTRLIPPLESSEQNHFAQWISKSRYVGLYEAATDKLVKINGIWIERSALRMDDEHIFIRKKFIKIVRNLGCNNEKINPPTIPDNF